MKELNRERLDYLLKIMHQKSIEYFENENSYEIRLIPELQQAYQQIKERIQKPEITEGFIEEKAIELYNCLYYPTFSLDQVKDFIRELVKEIQAK